jgi:predicted acylesterase/phospholipase RssA
MMRDDTGYVYHQEYDREVEAAEQAWIAARRKSCGGNGDPVVTTGLALSGGGIRSASFCLGVLQALHRYGRLKFFDFLSSVSGGGYTASTLSWYMAKANQFPFGVERRDCHHAA